LLYIFSFVSLKTPSLLKSIQIFIIEDTRPVNEKLYFKPSVIVVELEHV